MSKLEDAAKHVEEILGGEREVTMDTAEWDHLREYLAEVQARAKLDRLIWAFNISSFVMLMMAAGFAAFS